MSKSKVNLYCCGGTGANIGKYYEQFRDMEQLGFSEVLPCYIDTSKSNMRSIDEAHAFHIEGLDGNGKLRSQNTQAITQSVLSIINRFKPTEFSIVLHSASGGSGSTIGPSIVSELLSRDWPVIVVMIGSTDSVIELKNTIKTLKTYEAIGRMRQKPVPVVYLENDKTPQARSKTDITARRLIALLSMLLSKQNEELDGADVKNWINYHSVTSFSPRLTLLQLQTQGQPPKEQEVASVATLATTEMATNYPKMVEYHTVGFTRPEIFSAIEQSEPVHYVMVHNGFDSIHARLKEQLDEVESIQAARVSKASILSKDDDVTDNGLVF